MNNITIHGNIGKEPEMRYNPEGKPMTSFSVGLYTGKKDGQYLPSVWVRVTAWDDLAEQAGKLSKGQRVKVSGIPRPPRTWKDDKGVEHPAGLEITAREIETENKQEEDMPF